MKYAMRLLGIALLSLSLAGCFGGGTSTNEGQPKTNSSRSSLLQNSEKYSQAQVTTTTRVYDAHVVYPYPSWQNKGLPEHASKEFEHKDGRQYTFELIAKDQNFDNWKNIYTIK